jgi:hypothetical protein
MSRTAATLAKKYRARRDQREFERALLDASPRARQDLLAAYARNESIR